jgi:hypothetical protein
MSGLRWQVAPPAGKQPQLIHAMVTGGGAFALGVNALSAKRHLAASSGGAVDRVDNKPTTPAAQLKLWP